MATVRNHIASGTANTNSDKIVARLSNDFNAALKAKRLPTEDEKQAVAALYAEEDNRTEKPIIDKIDDKLWYINTNQVPVIELIQSADTFVNGVELLIEKLYQEELLRQIDDKQASQVIASKYDY